MIKLMTQKIIPHLWFDKQAEEAAKFYTSIFKNSNIGDISYYGKEGFEIHGMPEGTVMTVAFQLDGQDFVALNGGPTFKFTEAISLLISCRDQEEIDYFWNKLSEGGDPKAQICGWLKDKFGLSWQVIPVDLSKFLSDKNPEKSARVMREFLKMGKIELSKLKDAYEGKSEA